MNYSLSKWQKRFAIDEFDADLRIACTGVSAGKSYALSIWLVLQCLKNPGIRGIIIAQTYRALTLVLIREIRLRCQEMGIDLNWNRGNNELTFPNGSVLFAFSAENPDGVLGLTEIALLALDESAYCTEEIYNNARDRMRGSKYPSKVRLISSPSTLGRVANWFSTLCKKYPEKVIHATAFDNPFTSEEFKNELRERYGEGTNLFRQQCLGEIFDTDVASQIIFRHEFPQSKTNSGAPYYLGYDASGLGSDNDEIVIIDKFGMVDYKELNQGDTFEKVNVITNFKNHYDFKNAFADGTGGYSTGVLDVAKSKGIDIKGINFAQKAFNLDLYPNARTEMYIELAKAVKAGFWVNDVVKEELLAQGVAINSRGQQALLPKEEVKKILGHSPDLCDAVALAVYAMNHASISIYDTKKAADIADKYLLYHEVL
jgi:PBSX family phage terminase large subunit